MQERTGIQALPGIATESVGQLVWKELCCQIRNIRARGRQAKQFLSYLGRMSMTKSSIRTFLRNLSDSPDKSICYFHIWYSSNVSKVKTSSSNIGRQLFGRQDLSQSFEPLVFQMLVGSSETEMS